jgi:hypothetical protein
VVGKPHEIKGESVFAYVVLKGDRPSGGKAEAFTKALRDHVTEQLGAIARPDDIRFCDNLPKTRSGKIMRRLLRAIARNEDIAQDLSTLENPAIIAQLRGDEGIERRGVEKGGAPVKAKAAKQKTAAKKRPVRKKTAPKRKAAASARKKAAPKRKPVKKSVQRSARKPKRPARPKRKK